MRFRPFRSLPAAFGSASGPLVPRRPRPQPDRPEQRDRACQDLRVLAGKPWPAPDRRAPRRAADRLPARVLRGRAEAAAGTRRRRLRLRLGRLRRRSPRSSDVRARRHARGRDDERSPHGEQQAVYTLNQAHSYDWLGWNAAFAAVLLATGLGARRSGILPAPLAWATIVIGASLLTPLGFFAFMLLPLWLIVVGIWLSYANTTAPIRSRGQTQPPGVAVAGNPSS